MLDKHFVRKLDLNECRRYIDDLEHEKALTGIRLSRLLSTQDKNPNWAAYDKYADDIVGIDIRIEEQYAVAEMLEDDIRQLNDRIDIILGIVNVTDKSHPGLEEPAYQLGFFDSDKKRERMGVPC